MYILNLELRLLLFSTDESFLLIFLAEHGSIFTVNTVSNIRYLRAVFILSLSLILVLTAYIDTTRKGSWTMFLLLFPCPPIHEVCPNYEVVMYQPQTGTPLYLGSVANCYIDMILSTPMPFPPATRCTPGGDTHPLPLSIYLADHLVPTQDHSPIQASLVSVPEFRGPLLPKS